MKKIIMSLGFAAATILAVQAQETPQEQQTPQGKQIEDSGITSINISELPQRVTEGLENSEFQGATIENAFEVSGNALNQTIEEESVKVHSEDQYPEQLYQLQVNHKESSVILYFTKEGELYASKKL